MQDWGIGGSPSDGAGAGIGIARPGGGERTAGPAGKPDTTRSTGAGGSSVVPAVQVLP